MEWYNIKNVLKEEQTFNFIFGGRGIGKTYSTLLYLVENRIKFIYMRNAQNEIDISCTDECNPFKAVNSDIGSDIYFKKVSKEITVAYNESDPIGYGIALNTFAKMRGVDFSDIELILFDEFNTSYTIKKSQGEMFFNFYETVNRNREIKGGKPVIVLFLGNAISIASPIIASFDLIQDAESMLKNKEETRLYKERGILLQIVRDSKISESKKETALYKAIKGTDYYNHAIDNVFITDDYHNVRKCNVNEFKKLTTFEDLEIYTHKSDYLYYIRTGAKKSEFGKHTIDKFNRYYGGMLRNALIDNKVMFADYYSKNKLLTILQS